MKTIRTGVTSIFEELDKTTDLISKLKSIPRTGFEVRINKYSLKLPVQSIYDHILSVATNSDILVNLLDVDLNIQEVIYFIALHDLAETQIGDFPEFTSSELVKLSSTRQLTPEEKVLQEQFANEQILNIVPAKIREEFMQVQKYMDEEQAPKSKVGQFIWFADKTESITAVWRYIFNFKNTIDIENYIEAMSDFYTNPKILTVYSYNAKTTRLIEYLQSKENSKEYFTKGNEAIAADIPKLLIERPFDHTIKI